MPYFRFDEDARQARCSVRNITIDLDSRGVRVNLVPSTQKLSGEVVQPAIKGRYDMKTDKIAVSSI